MFRKTGTVQNRMYCRMLISRAWNAAEAFSPAVRFRRTQR